MEEQDVPVVKIRKKLKKGHGSFWIPKQAVRLLLLDNNSSAIQICTYLTIARHSDVNGMFSTIGTTGIIRKLGINTEQYERACKYLKSILAADSTKLLYTRDDWQAYAFAINADVEYENQSNVANPNYIQKNLLPTVPPNKGYGRKGYVQWVLNTFRCNTTDRVWFHNDIIENADKYKTLKRLMMFKQKDLIARLLLLMHYHYDSIMGGVRPYQNIYVAYDMNKIGSSNSIDIYRGSKADLRFSQHFRSVVNIVFGDIPGCEELIKGALKSLEGLGLIYLAVMVLDGDPEDKDVKTLYELDIKVNDGLMLKEKRSRLAAIVDDAVVKSGYESSSKGGKFYDDYSVITQEGICPTLVGMYRLKYALSNSKNAPVKQANLHKKEYKDMVLDWVNTLTGEVIEVSLMARLAANLCNDNYIEDLG